MNNFGTCSRCHRASCICPSVTPETVKLLRDEAMFLDAIRQCDPDHLVKIECLWADLRRVQNKLRRIE